ncbi:type II toxin-antitoxin system HicA family toxin [Conexibacter sp. DBS9H8]|uniref:type II toxin-antitoxin system HicA family toxin n=1 Tax=Conexibacter sp. DBS9H8 TaxID=2937801 RepID=UPI00353109B9
MKRRDFERHLREHGCEPIGGTKHEKWRGPAGPASVIPRHNEIVWQLARKICKDLAVPPPVASR